MIKLTVDFSGGEFANKIQQQAVKVAKAEAEKRLRENGIVGVTVRATKTALELDGDEEALTKARPLFE